MKKATRDSGADNHGPTELSGHAEQPCDPASQDDSDDQFNPLKASEISSSTVFKRCFSMFEDMSSELVNFFVSCAIDEFVALEEIQAKIKEIELTMRKLHQRDVLFIGVNGIGKSFILNLLLMVTCVDVRQYVSREFKRVRANLEMSFLEKGVQKIHDAQEYTGSGPVLRVLDYGPEPWDKCYELEALRGFEGEIVVIPVNPIDEWNRKYPEFARNFEHNPSKDQIYLLQRYEDFCRTLQLKEIGKEQDFANYILPSNDLGQSTTIICVKATFGCTFHLCLEFCTVDEILGRANDWIDIVETSIVKNSRKILQKRQNRFLQMSFQVLFPTLSGSKFDDVSQLPQKATLLQYLDPGARMLAEQKMHIFAGTGKNFHRDRMFVMKTFQDELGVGTLNRSHSELVKCFMIKSVKNYVPSVLLASGCNVIDTPGTGDHGPLQAATVRNALEENDVVVAMCPRGLKDAEGTYDALFTNVGPFSFTSRLLKDPVGKNLVVMTYYERADTEGKLSQILDQRLKNYNGQRKIQDAGSLETAMAEIESLSSSTFNKTEVEKSITAFTACPNLYASLILNRDFRTQNANIDEIVDATQGHKFFVLPEILAQNQLRLGLEGLKNTMNSIRDTLDEIWREERGDDGMLGKFSEECRKKLLEILSFRNARVEKGRGAIVKDMLDKIGSESWYLKTWTSVVAGDKVEVYFTDQSSRSGDWFDAKVLEKDGCRVKIVYLDKNGKEALDENGKPWIEDHVLSTDPKDGSLSCKQLRPSKWYSIDTLLMQFSTKGGFIDEIVNDYVQLIEQDLLSVIPKIRESIKDSFEELQERLKKNETEFSLKLLEIFSISCRGRSATLDLVDELLEQIVGQIYASFANIARPQPTNHFKFSEMMRKLRDQFKQYESFFRERISHLIYPNLCYTANDKIEMEKLFDEFMKIGSKSLQDRMDQVFCLKSSQKITSQVPDYDFLAEKLRQITQKQVESVLEVVQSVDEKMKIKEFLGSVEKILRSALATLLEDLRKLFHSQIHDFKKDFVNDKQCPFHRRFTHKLVFEFLEKLQNTIGRSADDRQKLAQELTAWCGKVEKMISDLPDEKDIGSDIASNMTFLKVQQDVGSKLNFSIVNKLKIRCENTPFRADACIRMNLRFAEGIEPLVSNIVFDSIPNSSNADVITFESSLQGIGYKLQLDVDRTKNTLWRALATQFESWASWDASVVEEQIRAAVADQILYWFNDTTRRAKAPKLLGITAVELAIKVMEGTNVRAHDEICVLFFVLCFGRSFGINIWSTSSIERPLYQLLLHPSSTPPSEIRAINIAILAQKSDSGAVNIWYAGMSHSPTIKSVTSSEKAQTRVDGQRKQESQAHRSLQAQNPIPDQGGFAKRLANILKDARGSDTHQMFVFDLEALFSFQNQAKSGKFKDTSLIEMFEQTKEAGKTIVLLVPFHVKKKISENAQILSDPMLCLDRTKRGEAYTYFKLNSALNEKYSCHKGENNIFFVMQDGVHWQDCCSKNSIDSAEAVLQIARKLKLQYTYVKVVAVSGNLEMQGICNQDPEMYSSLQLVKMGFLIREYAKLKSLQLKQKQVTEQSETERLWKDSFHVEGNGGKRQRRL